MYKFDFTFINDNISSFWIKQNQDSVSFLLKGNNDYEIKGVFSYGGMNLTDEITLQAGEINKLITVDLLNIYRYHL